MFVIIAGVVVVVGGAVLVTLGIQAIVKLIQKEYKLNKAIKDMKDEDPFNALYESDNFYQTVDRDHLKEVIQREEVARQNQSFFGRVKDFFSSEKRESAKLVKEIYKEKKQAIETDNQSPEIGTLEKGINQEHLSRAKTAYQILKSQRGREQYQKSLKVKPVPVSRVSDREEQHGENINTSKNKRRHTYQFEMKTTRLQRIMTFFREIGRPKQYQPTKRFEV